ncbi:hypothetical protein LWI28_019659 [Acer negundo]|uniref:Uncharacterized protein n=1 Tax=Acer negundo TaxID=4023 RepID=A0AAD5IWA3_ACENE|nr:hypothetical protein LWI28_019659 [Acer negundo]
MLYALPVFCRPAAIPFIVRIRVSSRPGAYSLVGLSFTLGAGLLDSKYSFDTASPAHGNWIAYLLQGVGLADVKGRDVCITKTEPLLQSFEYLPEERPFVSPYLALKFSPMTAAPLTEFVIQSNFWSSLGKDHFNPVNCDPEERPQIVHVVEHVEIL